MAGKRKVLCTSTGCIEYAPERYRNLNIGIIRIHIFFEGKEYLEGLDLDPKAFYKKLEALENPKDNLPYTGMPSTEELRAHYENAIAEGCDEVIIFALSSSLGGTYNKICLVGREYEDRLKITVVDTKITCFGEGLLAIKAAEMVERGVPTETILKEVRWMMEHQEFLGVDGRLDFLIYNGRLKGAKALMGKVLNYCPVIHFSKEGEIVQLETVRTQKKALSRMCEVLKEIIGDRSPEDYILWHVYTGEAFLENLFPIEEKHGIKVNHEDIVMSPVSGAHNGPWLAGYGIFFLRREDEPLE